MVLNLYWKPAITRVRGIHSDIVFLASLATVPLASKNASARPMLGDCLTIFLHYSGIKSPCSKRTGWPRAVRSPPGLAYSYSLMGYWPTQAHRPTHFHKKRMKGAN